MRKLFLFLLFFSVNCFSENEVNYTNGLEPIVIVNSATTTRNNMIVPLRNEFTIYWFGEVGLEKSYGAQGGSMKPLESITVMPPSSGVFLLVSMHKVRVFKTGGE